jgi:hypothetical protein
MVVVALAAVGFTALRSPSDLWAVVLFSATLAVLSASTLMAVLRRGADLARWVGFALFGWIYLVFSLVLTVEARDPRLMRSGTPPLVTELLAGYFSQPTTTPEFYVRAILHSLGTVISGVAGYVLASLINARGVDPPRRDSAG